MMLRVDDYRLAFVHLDGLNTLVNVLAGRVNFQLQYQVFTQKSTNIFSSHHEYDTVTVLSASHLILSHAHDMKKC